MQEISFQKVPSVGIVFGQLFFKRLKIKLIHFNKHLISPIRSKEKTPFFFLRILGCIPASELNHQILTHEEIYPELISKFAAFLQNVKFQAEPTVVAFTNNRKWQQIAKRIRHDKAGVRFQKNKEKYQLWLITSETPLAQEIQAFFKE